VLNLFREIKKLGCKPSSTPMDCKKKLNTEEGQLIENINQYQRLVGKLIYFTVTRSNLAFSVSQVSQFMHSLRSCHLEAIDKILKYLKRTPGKGILMKNNNSNEICGYTDAYWAENFDRKSTASYCTFVDGNIVT